ncbi:MAG TPA: CmcI family methyltransferase [Nitrososphaeraceae archaeon]|nr:CmcI family methyltransferase [Nitrososphaeraceae archaeon]
MTSKKEERVSKVLRELEQIAIREHLPSVGPIKAKIISAIIQKYKPTTILEIGTLHGYSAILMAADLLPVNDDDNNNKIDEKLVTIEIDKNLTNIAKKNIDNAGLSNKIEVICGNALDVIPTLAGYKFDLIFLDAVKNEYLQYLRLIEAKDLLKEGAIVVADNVIIYENEMQDYLEYVRNSVRYNSKSTETTLEFTKNVKDALEISVRLGK